MPEDFFWHCKEILEGLFIEHEKFIPKAKRILASLAPELLSSLNA
jgi:hypothetical protein